MRRETRSLLLASTLVALLVTGAPACAIPLDVPVARLHRAVWTLKEGAPADVWAITQTADGWMWFGGPDGLYRFDGNTFERVETEPPGSARSRAVSALMALSSGELVVGYHNGGIAMLKEGRAVSYHEADGFDSGTVFDMVETYDHQVWATSRTGVYRFDGARWHRLGPANGLPEGGATEVSMDVDGRMWISTNKEQIYYLDPGRTQFVAGPTTSDGPTALLQSVDGQIWRQSFGAPWRCPFQHAAAPGQPVIRKNVSEGTVFDRDGGVWVKGDRTVLRLDSPERIRSMSDWSGASLESLRTRLGENAVVPQLGDVKTMFQSRNGAIWEVTAEGNVDEITEAAILPNRAPALRGSSMGSLTTTPDGAVWIAARSALHGLWRLDGRARPIETGDMRNTTVVHLSRDGTLWLAADGWLWRRGAHGFVRDIAEPTIGPRHFAIAMADDDDTNSTWQSVYGEGLFLRRGDAWQRNGGLPALPAQEPTALANDAAQALWLAYADGRVIELAHGRIVRDLSAQEAQVGSVRVISVGRFVLVGGDRGLALLRDGRFRSLTSRESAGFEGLTGIVETPEGDVWLNGAKGVIRIAASELVAALQTGSSTVAARLFDETDGYPAGGATKVPYGNTIARATDGTLWFTSVVDVAMLDPKSVRPGDAHIPLVLRSVTTTAGRLDVHGPLRFQAGTRDVQVDYTALDFDYPDRERFRYRLTGLDDRWTNAGPRRQAFFTNLGPGHYRFEVESTNGIVPWQASPVAVDIDIPPTFLQSRYFTALCVFAAALAIALLMRVRERQIRQRERVKLNERERIARELHDTLLQSTLGLALKVQAATSRIGHAEPARAMLEEALFDADQLMIEGRDRIHELRADEPGSTSLEEAFERLGGKLAGERGVAFQLTMQGTARPLIPAFSQDVHRIGSEALLNAFRHARASRVEVELLFGKHDFRLRVRDDGVGIDPQVLRDGHVPGHWGLRGMRERAARLGGSLDVWGAPGAGTEIEFKVDAAAAYADSRSGRIAPAAWWRRLLARVVPGNGHAARSAHERAD